MINVVDEDANEDTNRQMPRGGINGAIKNIVMKIIHENEKANWERDVREVYRLIGMSLREGEMTWGSVVVEVLKIGQNSWTKDQILTNDQDETYMDRTLEQKSHYTTHNNREGAHVWELNLTHDKKKKIDLISDTVLVMILFMLLLEHSNYTQKKREAACIQEFHQTKGAMVGELLHRKDFLGIGAKNTVRSSPKTNWRCIKAYEELNLLLNW